jgi:hypothetical protein
VKKEDKRWLVLSAAALVLALCIFAGSFILFFNRSKNSSGLVPAQITARIISEMNYSDLVEVSPTQLSKHYDIPDGVIADSSLYMSKTSDSAAELACFQLTDSSKYDQLQSAISNHINSKAAGFKTLNPTQYNALKNAEITRAEKYVLVSVGSNSAADAKLFHEIVK